MKIEGEFKKIVVIVISTLVVAILVLSLLATNIQTRVKRVDMLGDRENAQVHNQKLEFKFNTPVSKVSSEVEVKIFENEEQVDLETKNFVIGESIHVFFENNLNYNSNYRVELAGVRDVYEAEVNSISTQFQTKSPSFYYMEQTDELDKLMKYDVESKEKAIVFETNNIQNYVFNNNYIAIVVEEAEYTDLIILDTNGNKVGEQRFGFKQIGKIDMTQTENRILFALQEYEYDGDFVVPTTGRELYYFDIELEKLEKFEYGGIAFDVDDIVISPDSNFVLVEDSTEGFYLIDLNDNTSGIALGRYISTGGFNRAADKILFLTFEPENYDRSIFITYYDIETGVKELTHGEYEVIDPSFFGDSDQVVYARVKEQFESRGVYRIVKSDLQGNESEVYDEDGVTLEFPKISYDDRYVVLEKYSYESLVDYNFSRATGYLTKPNRADLVIYDLQNNKVITNELPGIEAKWIW